MIYRIIPQSSYQDKGYIFILDGAPFDVLLTHRPRTDEIRSIDIAAKTFSSFIKDDTSDKLKEITADKIPEKFLHAIIRKNFTGGLK